MKFLLQEEPISKARHRSHIVSGHIMQYDPQKNAKMHAKFEFAKQMRINEYAIIEDGPIELSIRNFVKIPTSWSPKKKHTFEGLPCPSRPDIDNYAKFYFDVLNGIAYHDDKQITRCILEKVYSAIPRVEIFLWPFGEQECK